MRAAWCAICIHQVASQLPQAPATRALRPQRPRFANPPTRPPPPPLIPHPSDETEGRSALYFILAEVTAGNRLTLPRPEEVTPPLPEAGDVIELAQRCWDHNPARRPTMGEVAGRLRCGAAASGDFAGRRRRGCLAAGVGVPPWPLPSFCSPFPTQCRSGERTTTYSAECYRPPNQGCSKKPNPTPPRRPKGNHKHHQGAPPGGAGLPPRQRQRQRQRRRQRQHRRQRQRRRRRAVTGGGAFFRQFPAMTVD